MSSFMAGIIGVDCGLGAEKLLERKGDPPHEALVIWLANGFGE